MDHWRILLLYVFISVNTFSPIRASIGDTIMLNKVVAKGAKFNCTSVGAKIYAIDSLSSETYKSGSLAELLQQQSLIYVKTYGSGGLASVSLRGGSSRHTAVIWNGFNLRSPMSGGLNFSSLPAGFIDDVIIQPGGSSTMYGSGASSGIIFLSNNLPLNKEGLGINLSTEIASFGTYSGIASIGYSGSTFATRFRVGLQHARNDFVFNNKDKFGNPLDTLKHASFNRRSFAHQASLKIGQHSSVETDLWYIQYYKEIPASTLDYKESEASQQDENLRFALNFSSYYNRWLLRFRSGVINDNTYYLDPVEPRVETENKSLSVINEIEGKYSPERHQTIFLGINQTYEKASTEGYISDISRNRYSIYGRYNLTMLKDRFQASLESRQEIIDNKSIPFVFSLGSSILISSQVSIRGVMAKHYTLPVFDDLYWKEDGFARGNPDLKPEYGWNYEAGLVHSLKKSSFSLQHDITGYSNFTNDLIIWLPSTGNDTEESKWEPRNVDKSISRGFEIMGDAEYLIRKSAIQLKYIYSYADAVIINERPTGSEKQQRIYVPKHNISLSAGYLFNKVSVLYTQTYTGKCFYDDTHTIDAYSLSNLRIRYSLKCSFVCIDIYLKIRNMFNEQYQVMVGYAQPPRNYALGINMTF